jgi:hypothetical protein
MTPTLLQLAYQAYLQSPAGIDLPLPPAAALVVEQIQNDAAARIQHVFRRHKYINEVQSYHMLTDDKVAATLTTPTLRRCLYLVLRAEVMDEVRLLTTFYTMRELLEMYETIRRPSPDFPLKDYKDYVSYSIRDIVDDLSRQRILDMLWKLKIDSDNDD